MEVEVLRQKLINRSKGKQTPVFSMDQQYQGNGGVEDSNFGLGVGGVVVAVIGMIVCVFSFSFAFGAVNTAAILSPSPSPSPPPLVPLLGGAGLLLTQHSSSAGPQIDMNLVIPLYWAGAQSGTLYNIQFTAGNGLVTAAFDTGSSRFVITSGYEPSSTATPVTNPLTGQPCTSTVAYVSQSDTVSVFSDTVSFPGTNLKTPLLCSMQVADAIGQSPAGPPIVVQSFPVAAGSATSPGGLNVFGMSAVLTTTTVPNPHSSATAYISPACTVTSQPVYESALLQTLAKYYTPAGSDVVWSMMVGRPPVDYASAPAGFLAFGPVRTSCMPMQSTPMVPQLVNAAPGIASTPGRYYVVEVLYAAIGGTTAPLSSYTKFTGFPAFLLIDSGTSLVQIPGGNAPQTCAAINALQPGTQVIIVLQGDVVLTYGPNDVTYQTGPGTSSGVFQPMPDSEASQFSSLYDTGILGCVGQWGLLVEYNLTKKIISFGQPTL